MSETKIPGTGGDRYQPVEERKSALPCHLKNHPPDPADIFIYDLTV